MKKVVIWGHKLHSHTHSYIHYAFYKTFKYLDIETEWFDNTDNVSKYNFDNALFITEGQVDQNIPINTTAYYVLHNTDNEKYKQIPNKNKMMLQVYTNTCLRYNPQKCLLRENTYYDDDCLWTMWGTDLLPPEISINIDNLEKINNNHEKCSYFVGMGLPQWDIFKEWCDEHKIKYLLCGGFSKNNISSEENQRLIQKSIIAPSLQSDWQIDNDYIPCRIFKNISYGKMGITNNKAVNELFNGKLIYDKNINKLCDSAMLFIDDLSNLKILKELMENVSKNHTYLNIINLIFWFFREIKKNNIYKNIL